ncbi:MAG: hypothetical protein OXT72_08815, partial [Gammaproteobacteria bacterium]|nr:hypothetical protein [Gammaproteobacteria bacterium]
MHEPQFIPLPSYAEIPESEMKARAAGFLAEMRRRRTVRDYAGPDGTPPAIDSNNINPRTPTPRCIINKKNCPRT